MGPVVAIVSFVCSIGNVPLAAVLWNGGISFGGVIAFIFADLLILPILNIYRKYYGTRMMLTLLGTFYAAMVAAGYFVELIFGAAHLIPDAAQRDGHAKRRSHGTTPPGSTSPSCVLAVVLVVRFITLRRSADGAHDGRLPRCRASPEHQH